MWAHVLGIRGRLSLQEGVVEVPAEMRVHCL